MTVAVADTNEPSLAFWPDSAAQADRTIQLASRFDEVSETLVTLRPWLTHRIGYECGSAWELALAECLNNIVKHAYQGKADHVIDLWISVRQDSLCVTLRDSGQPMPQATLPQSRRPDLECHRDALPEGGFGWFLIHALTSDLVYTRKAGMNWTGFKVSLRD